jgi:hypothetical protein
MTLLHELPDFNDLLAVVGDKLKIDPGLVEKDYWIMHSLWGLQQLKYKFELKGGTSLSKGLGLIHRFSEDIDIRIEPPATLKIGKNHDKAQHIADRFAFYDDLAAKIKIAGVTSVVRDKAFDDKSARSGGIRLAYTGAHPLSGGIKEGILLEVGFDTVAPNRQCDISSWAYDHAVSSGIEKLTDNRALGVACYEPGYTLVEKLQTISTKYRQQQGSGSMPKNFMRHYYDVYCLLDDASVQAFVGTAAYKQHKQDRFPAADNHDIATNEAFFLKDPAVRKLYASEYASTSALYYNGQPPFDDLLARIAENAPKL